MKISCRAGHRAGLVGQPAAWTRRPLRTTCGGSNVAQDQAPPGCSRYTLSLKKPLGIIFEQWRDTGLITVAELSDLRQEEGKVQVGDQLLATSGVVYTKESDYGGVYVKGGQQVVRLQVAGESIKTVKAAISSHPGHIAVQLELQRCQPQAVQEQVQEGGSGGV